MPNNPRTPATLDEVVELAVRYLAHPAHGATDGNREAAYHVLTHGAALRGATVTGTVLLDAIDAVIAEHGNTLGARKAIKAAAIDAVVAAQPADAQLVRR